MEPAREQHFTPPGGEHKAGMIAGAALAVAMLGVVAQIRRVRVERRLAEVAERVKLRGGVGEGRGGEKEEGWYRELEVVYALAQGKGIVDVDLDPREGSEEGRVLAFEGRETAERMMWLMRSNGLENVRVVPMSPGELEREAERQGKRLGVVAEGEVSIRAGETLDQALNRVAEVEAPKALEAFYRGQLEEGQGESGQPGGASKEKTP